MSKKPTAAQKFAIRSKHYANGTAYSERGMRQEDKPGVDMELVKKRRAVEESIEARKQLEELGIFL